MQIYAYTLVVVLGVAVATASSAQANEPHYEVSFQIDDKPIHVAQGRLLHERQDDGEHASALYEIEQILFGSFPDKPISVYYWASTVLTQATERAVLVLSREHESIYRAVNGDARVSVIPFGDADLSEVRESMSEAIANHASKAITDEEKSILTALIDDKLRTEPFYDHFTSVRVTRQLYGWRVTASVTVENERASGWMLVTLNIDDDYRIIGYRVHPAKIWGRTSNRPVQPADDTWTGEFGEGKL